MGRAYHLGFLFGFQLLVELPQAGCAIAVMGSENG